ncbi:MAG: hypothetical protein Q4G14_01300 [Paracoccus sp. (in: a-proteobacteria)]|uniref:hypothetical protein n=1 Tax=Paracoccus sp. TaxID=267 RepID=UPI0026DECED2|nr:hypothetical protein [Paracoccus sp. (in: a-proteobacteria)]MDO5611861.1 hypothetical protein [Paracoccus sp. (in: a-proteobacteria)]
MRLRLELRGGPQAGAARITDLDRPFSVGTDPAATWQLRAAPDVADGTATLHRGPGDRIEATGAGNVTLDGALLGERAASLGYGAMLIVAGQQVLIQPEAPYRQAGFGDAALSISAILSDVTPGGEAAAGPLPGADSGDSPLDIPAQHRPASERYWQQPRAFAPDQSPLSAGQRPILPDNWAADMPDDAGQLTDRSHQAAASLGRINVNPRPALSDPAAHWPAPDPDISARHEAQLVLALTALERIEDDLRRQFADLGVMPGTSLPPMTGGDDGGQGLMQRRDRIIAMQQALAAACRAALTDARTRLDPGSISASVSAAGGLAGRISPAAACWKEYQTRFAPPDQPAPLSDAAFIRHLRAASGQPEQTWSDQTEDDR